MSNDQLSWDQLFQQSSEDDAKSAKPDAPAKQEPAKASSTGEVPPEPPFDVESKNPELASVSPKPKRKSTKRQEASQKPNSDAGAAEEKLYSKKTGRNSISDPLRNPSSKRKPRRRLFNKRK